MDAATGDAFVTGARARWEDLGGGVRRQVLGHLGDLMVVRVNFVANATGAMHHHPHRQITYVAAGRFKVTVGDASRVLEPGDCFVAVSGVLHGVVALEAGTLIDTFTPRRDDFLPPW